MHQWVQRLIFQNRGIYNNIHLLCFLVVFRDKWIYVQKGSTKEVSTEAFTVVNQRRFGLRMELIFSPLHLSVMGTAHSVRRLTASTSPAPSRTWGDSTTWQKWAKTSTITCFRSFITHVRIPLFHLQLFQLIARSQLPSLSGAAQKNYFNILEKIVRKGKEASHQWGQLFLFSVGTERLLAL